jgi:hypothetical protein
MSGKSRRPKRVPMDNEDPPLPDAEPPADKNDVAVFDRGAGSRSEAAPKLLHRRFAPPEERPVEDGSDAAVRRRRRKVAPQPLTWRMLFATLQPRFLFLCEAAPTPQYGYHPWEIRFPRPFVIRTQYGDDASVRGRDLHPRPKGTWPRECGPAPLQVLALIDEYQNGGTGGWDLVIARESLRLPNPTIPDDVIPAHDDIGVETAVQREDRDAATQLILGVEGAIIWSARPLKGLTRAAQREAVDRINAFERLQQQDTRYDERWTRTPSPRAWFYVRAAAKQRIELAGRAIIEPPAYRMPARLALEFYKEHTRAAQEIAHNGRARTSEWRSDWTGEYGREARISHTGRTLQPAKPKSQWRARPLSLNPYVTSTKGIGTHQKGGVVERADGKCRESLTSWLARHPWWDFRHARYQVVEAATSVSSAAASRRWLNRKCFHWNVQPSWNVETIPADNKPVARKVWTGDARRACVTAVCTSMGVDDHRQYCAAYARALEALDLAVQDSSSVAFDFNNPVGRKDKLRLIGKVVEDICKRFEDEKVLFARKPGRKKTEKPKQPPKRRGRRRIHPDATGLSRAEESSRGR